MIEGLRKALRADIVLNAIAYVGVLCLIIAGCIPENVDIPGHGLGSSIVAPDTIVVADSVPVLEVSVPNGSANYFSEGISFEHTADEISIAFRIAEEWMVKVVDVDNNPVDWCLVSPSLGGVGLHEMKISIKENTGRGERTAHILFMAFEDVSKTAMIEVRQEGVNLFLERTDYEVASGDTTIVVELKANVDFEYKIMDAEWIREQPVASRALTTHNVTFAIDDNPSHKSREAHILFYNSQYPVAVDTLTLVQQGLTPVVTVPAGYTDYFSEDLVFGYVKGEAEVVFHSNVDWTLQLVAASGDSTSWCSIDQSSGKIGQHKVKVSVTDNNTYEHRSAVLRLMCDTTEMGEIQVVQNRESAILLGRQDYTVSCEATTIDVSVSTNVDFEYKIIDADWVRERQSATRGLTTHNLAFEVDANPSHKPRETRIVFYSSEYAVADTLTMVQEGVVPMASIPEGYTDYFTNALSFGPMASEAEVTFQVNVDWQLSIDSSVSWLSVESSLGAAGQQTITVRVTENNTKTDRAATIRLKCDDIKLAEIAVTQEKKVIELMQTEYTVSCEATTIDVSVSTNVDFEYKIIDTDWVRELQSVTRGLTTHNLAFEVDTNPSTKPREAKIVFYSSEYAVADTLTITQREIIPKAFIPEGYIDYFANGLTFDPMAGEIEVAFHVNVDWHIQLVGRNLSSWFSVEPSSGTAGLQIIKFRVTENNTTSNRTGMILLEWDDTTLAEIAVAQEKKVIELMQTEYNVSCEATTIDVSVSTNADFEYGYEIVNADWVREQQSTTQELMTRNLVFEVDANPSPHPREAKIVFHTADGGITKTLTIVQEGIIPEASILEGSHLRFDYTAGEKEFTFQVNVNWSITIASVFSNWISVDPVSGSPGLHTIKVNVKENLRSGLRSDTLGIRSDTGELLASICVDQEYNSDAVVYAVDLGLSVMWATCNVGADSPEDYGGRYAWGETEEKDNYSIGNYKYVNNEDGDDFAAFDEYIDIGNNIGGTKYDVAHVKWGSSWRMPTADEMRELVSKCSWTWERRNGVDGYIVRGNNGRSIFLPTENHTDYYWSETIEYKSEYDYLPQSFYLTPEEEIRTVCDWHNGRWEGFFVRPVTEY